MTTPVDATGPSLEERVQRDPSDLGARLALADQLVAHGEVAGARELLAPLEASHGPFRLPALIRLATWDENEGQAARAAARWERLLADDIDHDEAWAHLTRLRRVLEARAPGPPTAALPAAAPPTLDSAAGVQMSRYQIVRELGRGGSATVYLARDRELELDLALKVLHPRTSGPAAAELDRRFFHEARTAAALRHPGVVAIYDLDEHARTLVMEFLPGGTLRERLRGGRGLPADEAEGLARRLLATLSYVHGRGVVHGDLTPRNVLLRRPGEPVLADFGIARLREGSKGEAPHEDSRPAGTPLYLAPEQFHGSSASVATDLFALGAILWEALAGRPMRRQADLLADHVAARPLPQKTTGPLPALIDRLTRTDPALRPASAAEALHMLRSS